MSSDILKSSDKEVKFLTEKNWYAIIFKLLSERGTALIHRQGAMNCTLKIEEQTVHTTLKISLKKEKFQKNKNLLKTDKITATDKVNVIQTGKNNH